MWVLLGIMLAVEIGYRPRLDFTRDRDLLLWYGDTNEREYFFICKIPKM